MKKILQISSALACAFSMGGLAAMESPAKVHIIVSNQSPVPCYLFTGSRSGSNPLIVHAQEDSSPLSLASLDDALWIAPTQGILRKLHLKHVAGNIHVLNLDELGNGGTLCWRGKDMNPTDVIVHIDQQGHVSVINRTQTIEEEKQTEEAQENFRIALSKRDFEMATYWLQEGGAEINTISSFDGHTALTRALSLLIDLSKDTVRFLLTHGADVNAPNKSGNRPLWCLIQQLYAYESTGGDIIQELATRGASPYLENNGRHTVQDFLTKTIGMTSVPERYRQILISRGLGHSLGL